jgi:hypothetical protein
MQCSAVKVRRAIKCTTIIGTQTDRQNTCSLNPTALQPATPFVHQGVSPLPAHSAIGVWLDCTQYVILQGQSDQCINQTTVQYLVLSLIPGGVPPLKHTHCMVFCLIYGTLLYLSIHFVSFSMCVVQQCKLWTLHSVSDKWLNECGAAGMKTVEMELLGDRNLSQCHFVYENRT